MGLIIFYIIFLTLKLNVGSILHNSVNPIEYCYGFEYYESNVLNLKNFYCDGTNRPLALCVEWPLVQFMNLRCSECSSNSSHRLSIHQNSVVHIFSIEAKYLMWHNSTIGNQIIIVFFYGNAFLNSNNVHVNCEVPQMGLKLWV